MLPSCAWRSYRHLKITNLGSLGDLKWACNSFNFSPESMQQCNKAAKEYHVGNWNGIYFLCNSIFRIVNCTRNFLYCCCRYMRKPILQPALLWSHRWQALCWPEMLIKDWVTRTNRCCITVGYGNMLVLCELIKWSICILIGWSA